MAEKNVRPILTYSDDGHGSATATPTSGTAGTTVAIKATASSGYGFKEWKVISGGIKPDDEKSAETSFKIGTENVEIKAIFEKKDEPEPEPKKKDKKSSSGDSTPPNPDALAIIYIKNGAQIPSARASKQVQGPVAQAIFKQVLVPGCSEAFSFNLMSDGVTIDYELKDGKLVLFIPGEFQKAGRKFALVALGSDGVHFYPDTDNSVATITVDLDLNGYAFDLVYAD